MLKYCQIRGIKRRKRGDFFERELFCTEKRHYLNLNLNENPDMN